MMKKGEKDRGSEEKKSQFTKTYKGSVNLLLILCLFLVFWYQIHPTLSTECWVGFRAKQAPVMGLGKAENETE